MSVPVISVGVMSASEVHFTLEGDFTFSGGKGKYTGPICASRAGSVVSLISDGKTLLQGTTIELTPVHPEAATFTLLDVVIGVQFHWQRKENQKFVGSLKLIASDEGVTAINVVSVEDYLASVISSEMSASSSPQLLKAHAITSRSWLLAQLEKSRTLKSGGSPYTALIENDQERVRWYDREDHLLFDVCADDHCQRYQGVTRAYTASVRSAVDETRGQVLLSEGKICDARFSKSCGGISELFENSWEPVHHPYLTAVIDFPEPPEEYETDLTIEENADTWIRSNPPAFCNTSDAKVLSQVLVDFDQETTDFYRWKKEYSQLEISELIRRRSGIDFGDILDLVPLQRGASGRLIRLKIVGSKRTLVIGKDLEIRRTLSTSHLYSSAFVVDKLDISNGVPGKFILTGAGWGHGVGLCQIGAAVMGELGYPHEKILTHYFTGARIETLYR